MVYLPVRPPSFILSYSLAVNSSQWSLIRRIPSPSFFSQLLSAVRYVIEFQYFVNWINIVLKKCNTVALVSLRIDLYSLSASTLVVCGRTKSAMWSAKMVFQPTTHYVLRRKSQSALVVYVRLLFSSHSVWHWHIRILIGRVFVGSRYGNQRGANAALLTRCSCFRYKHGYSRTRRWWPYLRGGVRRGRGNCWRRGTGTTPHEKVSPYRLVF